MNHAIANLYSKLSKSLGEVLYSADNDEVADKFIKENNLPNECVWRDEGRRVELTVMGYLNGVILSGENSTKRLVATVEDNNIISLMKFEEYP